mmetsp:Transcript_31680/g.46572  ORF Transcript_31680/g.46572 Transcript_31680/m.46572 type:complete len:82 (-) Transcript_31680:252-497(-)
MDFAGVGRLQIPKGLRSTPRELLGNSVAYGADHMILYRKCYDGDYNSNLTRHALLDKINTFNSPNHFGAAKTTRLFCLTCN